MTYLPVAILVILACIILVAIAAYFSFRSSVSVAEPITHQTMQERQAELRAKMRRETGHVDTVMITKKED